MELSTTLFINERNELILLQEMCAPYKVQGVFTNSYNLYFL